MRASRGLAVFLSVMSVMTALAALVAAISMLVGRVSLLNGDMESAKHTMSQADKMRLYNTLMMQTLTSPEESREIAAKLGVPETEMPKEQKMDVRDAEMEPETQQAAAAIVHHDWSLRGLNVPYFSRFVNNEPQDGAYPGRGMHAATAAYKKVLAREGIVDDDGVHYLNAQQDKALAQELNGAIQDYASTELRDPTARDEGAPLSSQDDRQLARELNNGIKYAFLPSHGRVPAQSTPIYVTGEQRQKLVRELEQGERYAQVDVPPLQPRGIDARKGKELVRSLEMGQRYADLPNFGRPLEQKMVYVSPEEVNKEQQLVRDLQSAETFANVGDVRRKGDKLRAVQKAWGLPSAPQGGVVELTQPQDKNLATYLEQGLRDVFGSGRVAPRKMMSQKQGKALIKGAQEGQWAEYQESEKDRPRYQTPEQAKALAASLAKTIKYYNGVGANGKEQVKHVSVGSLPGYQTQQQAMTLSHSLSNTLKIYHKGSGAYVNEYIKSVKGHSHAAAGPMQSEGLQFKRDAKRDEALARAQGPKVSLETQKEKELAEFLAPQQVLVPGQAPALGYAV